MTEVLPAHTRLSASGAKRWMNCSGSVALLAAAHFPEDDFDGSEWSSLGTDAHTLGSNCLTDSTEPWQHMGEGLPLGHLVDQVWEGVQVYVDYCRMREKQSSDWIWKTEQRVDDKTFHPDFGGTADRYGVGNYWLEVIDYKNGAGVTVDVEENEQLMYYGYGILRKYPAVKDVRLTVVQPNGFHPDGPIRSWCISAEDLRAWAETKLYPAMLKVDTKDVELVAGDWCQFCPRKIRCPLLTKNAATLAAITTQPADLTDERLAELLKMAPPVMSLFKSLKQEGERRLLLGQEIDGQKLVKQKADRVWKDGAEAKVVEAFGEDAYVPKKLKSPAQIEELPDGKATVAEWAYKPDVGLAIAPLSDKRAAQKPPSAASIFNLDNLPRTE